MESVLARVSEATGVPIDLLGRYVSVLAAAAATGRPPGRADIDAMRECGAAAAERGIPLRVLTDACLQAAEIVSGGVFPAVRRSVAAFAEGYERAQLEAVRREEEARHRFADDLLPVSSSASRRRR